MDLIITSMYCTPGEWTGWYFSQGTSTKSAFPCSTVSTWWQTFPAEWTKHVLSTIQMSCPWNSNPKWIWVQQKKTWYVGDVFKKFQPLPITHSGMMKKKNPFVSLVSKHTSQALFWFVLCDPQRSLLSQENSTRMFIAWTELSWWQKPTNPANQLADGWGPKTAKKSSVKKIKKFLLVFGIVLSWLPRSQYSKQLPNPCLQPHVLRQNKKVKVEVRGNNFYTSKEITKTFYTSSDTSQRNLVFRHHKDFPERRVIIRLLHRNGRKKYFIGFPLLRVSFGRAHVLSCLSLLRHCEQKKIHWDRIKMQCSGTQKHQPVFSVERKPEKAAFLPRFSKGKKWWQKRKWKTPTQWTWEWTQVRCNVVQLASVNPFSLKWQL